MLFSLKDFSFFLWINYLQIVFLLEKDAVARNVVGWMLVVVVCTKVILSTELKCVLYFRELFVRARKAYRKYQAESKIL